MLYANAIYNGTVIARLGKGKKKKKTYLTYLCDQL